MQGSVVLCARDGAGRYAEARALFLSPQNDAKDQVQAYATLSKELKEESEKLAKSIDGL